MRHEHLSVDIRPDQERVVLTPHGELDHFTAEDLRASLEDVVSAGWHEVVLDLRGLDFMDAGGIHLLEDIRDGKLGAADWSMLDGVGAAALPVEVLGGPRLLPLARVGS